MERVHYRRVMVGDLEIFYREAGNPEKHTLLLLHGFPSSSHMFRELMPLLASHFHLVAPDLPGFGNSSMPPRVSFSYSFDNLANVIDQFTDVLELQKFSLYIFDIGAPIGLRVAMKRPDRINAIISQNGNAYEEGFGEVWAPIRQYWADASETNRNALRAILTPEAIRWQYEHGVTNLTRVSPEGYTLDAWYMARPEAEDVQLDIALDYRTNVALYPAFQRYLRTHQPKFLAIWGDKDPFFLPAGAEAYKRDIPAAQVHFLATGHFALETHVQDIAAAIIPFLTH